MKDLPASLWSKPRSRNAVNKSRVVYASALAGVLSAIAAPAFANETTMRLIEIMRDNGSISQAQYEQLRAAAAEDETQTEVQVEAEPEESDWTSNIELTGDIRLRYQYGDNSGRLDDNGDQVDRHRGRVRYRLGIIATPLDRLEVGAGLASGGDDPRSTNQTFDNNFSSKGINLDFAYAQYQFTDAFTAIAGKFDFDDYLWVPTDLLWDGDIRPEGTSAKLNLDNAIGTTFVQGGVWVLNEFSSNDEDPFLYYGQIGQEFEAGNVFATLAGTYYGYENTDQEDAFNPDFSAGTNTDDEFGVVNINGELGTKFSSGKASLIGEYAVNTDTDTDEDTAYALGAKLGFGKWSFKYIYADLDANATPDVFPDSDRFGGGTDVKGHEIAGAYALNDTVEVGLDYYNTERKSVDVDEQILQADLEISF